VHSSSVYANFVHYMISAAFTKINIEITNIINKNIANEISVF